MADDDDIGDIEVLDLQGRLEQWRQQHPKRNYVGSQLVEASGGLPRSQQEQIAGHVYSPARRAAGGTASGVPGAASGAPPSEPYWEVVNVPFSQVIPVGQRAVQAPGGSNNLLEPELFQYRDSDSGQRYQHTTSIGRMDALARSHPLVWTTTTCRSLPSVRNERREVDCKGRVTSGPQSSFELSLALVSTLKVFRVGLTTGPGPEFFSLRWKTEGEGWTHFDWLVARNVFFDIIELDASHFLDNQAGARGEEVPNPVGAFGGSSSLPAPKRPTFEVSLSDEEDSDDNTRPGSSTSTSYESECEYSGDDEVLPEEEEEQAGAASGALRGVKQQQSELDAKSAEEKKDNKVVLARARRAIQQRQVHFRDVNLLWPEESYMWLEEAAHVDERRECLLRLLSVLGRECATFPSEEGILKGIPHMNRKRQNEPFEVAHALSTHKLHYQPVLTERLKDVRFEDTTCAFCRAWPNLHPVSGGDHVVRHVNHAHPVWDVLRETMGVRTVPDFLKHLFTKHDGEARLIGGTSWTPMMTTHVCNPKFWSYQFARTGETRKWQYRKKPDNKLINGLRIGEVQWVLDQGEGQTLLIRS